jgi:hypothetical protein
VQVGGGGVEGTERLRARVARGRPNWWVILAVSLALMALLVATAGAPPDRSRPRPALGESSTGDGHPVSPAVRSNPGRASSPHTSSSTTTTTTSRPTTTTTATASTALVSAHGVGDVTSPPATKPTAVTTTTVATTATTTTTTTAQPASLPADRMQTQGYLNPPVQTSNGYGFTGTGATQVSVVWSEDTYLTMTVGCPDGSQSVGGTSAMEASLPAAQGSCEVTVSEPSSESTSLTYTITIAPAGG